MSVFSVRNVRRTDSSSLAHIQVDSYRRAYAGLLPQDYLDHFTYEEQTQDWLDLLADANNRDLLLVAETPGGEIAGYALARPEPTAFDQYDSELVALHVRQEYQSQGAGSALIAAAARSLHELGCRALLLWTLAGNPARAIYEHLGGALLGEHQAEIGENILACEVAYGWPDIRSLYQSIYRVSAQHIQAHIQTLEGMPPGCRNAANPDE